MASEDAYTKKLRELTASVVEEYDADVIVYSGELVRPHDERFLVRCHQRSAKPNVLLMMTTYGGSADAAYRVARCLQRQYRKGKVTVFVNTDCHSAGMLLLIGADEIVMSDRGELGPLDVQIRKPEEIGEYLSGLTPIQALSSLGTESFNLFQDNFLKLRFRSGLQISTKSAADIAAQIAVGLFRPIYEQLDPMRLCPVSAYETDSGY